MQNRFLLDKADAKLMGVCAGIANYSGIDATLVRVAMVLLFLTTGPVALILYLLAGWIAPRH